MKIKIYCLYEPNTCKIRYIGRTKNSLKERLNLHLTKARNNYSNSYKENWIRKLLKNGIKPQIRLLEEIECTWKESHIREKELIQKHLIKHNLVNGDDRGPGKLAKNITEENEKLRVQKIKQYFNKRENKRNFYNKIYCYDSNGNFYKEFESSCFAVEFFNISSQQLCNHLNKFDNSKTKVNSLNGFYFSKFKMEKFPISDRYQSNHVKVALYKDNTFYREFKNLTYFAKHFNLNSWDIHQLRLGIDTKRIKEVKKTFEIRPL